MTLDLEYPEGATPLSDEEKEGLLLSHITDRSELNLWEQRGISSAASAVRSNGPSSAARPTSFPKTSSGSFTSACSGRSGAGPAPTARPTRT
jgi:hypothetical protein